MRMFKNRIFKICFLLIIISSAVSCKKYLDVTPDNVATIDFDEATLRPVVVVWEMKIHEHSRTNPWVAVSSLKARKKIE